MEDQNPARGLWQTVLGFFIANKLLVAVPVALMICGGLIVAPFDWQGSGLPRQPLAVDAIPDTAENQQIVFTEWPGRSPRDVEDQITYPLTTALLSVAKVRTVRSASRFGFSSIYVIFEEDAGFYWSRARLLEKLASLRRDTLPPGVSPRLGPEATALGQIFWYTLEGRNPAGEVVGGWDRDELRAIQDWTIRYSLQAVSGVAEVASVGGQVREYQVDINPEALAAHGVTLEQVANAVRGSNQDIGARTIEINRVEYIVRSRGFIEHISDIEQAVVTVRDHVPLRVGDIAHVGLGPANRRGALDDAGAEVVGGVVVARYGANPLAVIAAVKAQIARLAPTLPQRKLADGTTSQVTIVPFYDRTALIHETLDTLSTALIQQILITVLVVLVMLRHLRSSALVSVMLPLAVLTTFLAMAATGVDANVMSLAGIAIAIGTMVDMGIVIVENIIRHLDDAPERADRLALVRRATAEVAPAIVTSMATTVVSFLPVFALTAAEGKMFRPLAFTKSYALLAAVVLALAVLPALAHLILSRRPHPLADDKNWRARAWRSIGRPAHIADWATVAVGVVVAITLSLGLGSFLVLVGGLRLLAPLLSQPRRRIILATEILVAVVGVTLVLTDHWRPLGLGRSLLVNLVFVAIIVVALLGAFALFQRSYARMLTWCLGHKRLFLTSQVLIVVFGITVWLGFDRLFGWTPDSVRKPAKAAFPGLGREFMPPFDEGSFLYMPTTAAHASFGQALELLQQMDAAIATVPEVDRVIGKLGRADSALDPAPVSMFESVITYLPEYGRSADGHRVRNWRDHIKSPADIWDEISKVAKLPGLTSAPVLMPIEARRVMLQTGMRGAMGLKIQAPDLASLDEAGRLLEAALKQVDEVRAETVTVDRVVGKPYLEIVLDREAIAHWGLTVHHVQQLLQVAMGGGELTRTFEGRERYPVRVRYMREERDSVAALLRLPVSMPGGDQVPLGELAAFEYVRGPQVIKSEDTFNTSYLLFDKQRGLSEVEVVDRARAHIEAQISSGALLLPDNVTYDFTGNYENQMRSEARLKILLPVALAIVFMLLYLQFRRFTTTLIIYSGVVLGVAGGFILIWLYGRPEFLDIEVAGVGMRELFRVDTVNMSVAVWVGFIALIGLATDNGVILATYLDQQFKSGAASSVAEVRARVAVAGLRRVRPCLMTTATTMLALLPVITSRGRGADVMVPMAVPLLGGMAVALLALLVVPTLYALVEERALDAAGD